ncbi:MAG: CapA family protein [Agathobacter sp.]|nr:CapA family protein [Agathobacter sp.]
MPKGKYERPKEPMSPRRKTLLTIICILSALLVIGLIIIAVLPDPTPIKPPTEKPVVEATTEPTATEPPEESEAIVEPEETEPVLVATASLGATGDILLHKGVINSGKIGTNTYNFDEIFKYVTEYYNKYDIMVANMEGTLSGGDSDDDYVGYPCFNAPDAIATSLSTAGVDIMLTANNHTYDYGNTGMLRTQDVITENKMEFLGTQKSDEDNDFVIKDVNGIQIGMMAYTYESGDSNGHTTLNGIVVKQEDTQRISSFDYTDLDSFYKEVELNMNIMRNNGAEVFVMFIHWGDEYSLEQNEKQEEIANKLNVLGVDVIIGGHPHVIQPFRVLTSESGHKTYCIYSLGNAVSNQNKNSMSDTKNGEHTSNGLIVGVTFEEWSDGRIFVKEFTLIPTYVYKTINNGKNAYYIIPMDDTLPSWKQFNVPQNELDEAYENALMALGAVG